MISNSKNGTSLRPRWSIAVLLLALAATGLPVNDLQSYGLLVFAAVIAFTGVVATQGRPWLIAVAIAAAAIVARLLLAPAPIEEGHNLFLPKEFAPAPHQTLPPPVVAEMQTQFDRLYPAEKRCTAGAAGCWTQSRIDKAFAFSGDGIWQKPEFSRRVTGIDFENPLWLRLGFVNDDIHNWYSEQTDLQRATRDRKFWKGYDRWRFEMPWFVMYRFPAAYEGSQLCWRGTVMWDEGGGNFKTIRSDATDCRTIVSADVGKSIFGIAIAPDSLAMKLKPPASVQARLLLQRMAAAAAIFGILLLLVRVNWRGAGRAAILIGLSVIVILIDDGSFLGGVRPLEGGDDGLFYMGVAREIAQYLASGDIYNALLGREPVYFYGGPGLRYFRALEMFVFGDSNLGYLSLVLMLPFVVYRLYRRFFGETLAWPLALIFTALPIGEVFGTSFVHYERWASRGFADPMSQILFICGLTVILWAPVRGRLDRAEPLFWGALLLALSVFMKPIIAPMVGVFLAGVGLMTLYQRVWRSTVALCLGFTPFLLMPLHNIYFGKQFVLLSSNACLPGTCAMPPSDYALAFKELLRFDFGGAHVAQWLQQMKMWLSGPGQLAATIPLHAAAVALLIYVLVARRFGLWLRLLAATALVEHAAAWIYLPTPRYFYAMWFVTALVTGAALVQLLPLRWLRFVPGAEDARLVSSRI